jgi:transposase
VFPLSVLRPSYPRATGVLSLDSAVPRRVAALQYFGAPPFALLREVSDFDGRRLLPRRWVVERTLAWLNRNRRLAKDFEASIASAKAWVYIASVQLLIRRLV